MHALVHYRLQTHEKKLPLTLMSTSSEDLYAVLGLSRRASSDDIKKAYRRLALQFHPDKNPQNRSEAEEKFKAIAKAYEVLSDPEKRRVYDLRGRDTPSSTSHDPFRSSDLFMNPFSMYTGFGRRARRSGDLDDAFRVFEEFFGGRDPFADMLDDSFFNRGFQGAHTSSSSSFMSRGGSGSFSMSSSSSSTIRNGKRVTRTEKSVRHADGRVESTIIEETQDLRTGETSRRVIENGGNHPNRLTY